MKKSFAKLSAIMALVLAVDAAALCMGGCGTVNVDVDVVPSNDADKAETEDTKKESEENGEEVGILEEETVTEVKKILRPTLLGRSLDSVEKSAIKPSVASYTTDKNFSNVINPEYVNYIPDAAKEKLYRNLFVVYDGGGREFFDIYEGNRYGQTPSFITVDSLLHTYHLYFAHLQRNTEKNYLDEALKNVTKAMLESSVAQYDELAGTEFEAAAVRNVEFFGIADKLLELNDDIPAYAKDVVESEVKKINACGGIDICDLTDDYEDYSQFKPRGYYEGNEQLEKYFKAMMWYGRVHFEQNSEELDRSALLMTLAMDNDSFAEWESIYTITSFFAGAADDNGYYEYKPLIESVYGDIASVKDIAGNDDAWKKYHAQTEKLKPPVINSCVIDDGDDNIIPGFRFMGQRFSIDAEIMQKLIYSCVDANENDDMRMLPEALDVPAAFGSDIALDITSSNGAKDFPDYAKNMTALREKYADSDNDPMWTSSLYANWLNMLKPLIEKKHDGLPAFMLTNEWAKKDLESFCGSYTELKHDTVLYSKQVMAEMGGGWEEDIDDRGYVEPEVDVYARFIYLSEETANGLKNFGMLSKEDEENLRRLTELAKKLKTISEKELINELPTDEEFEFIREYGGDLEHFFMETVKDEVVDSDAGIYSDQYPAALVVDVATDPNGEVLELAEGDPGHIYVIVPVDGVLRIASGSVYSFYEFTRPIEERMTDKEWRELMGISICDDGSYNYDDPDAPDRPEWTQSYREDYDPSMWN